MKSTYISELIATRLSHDLSGSIGAVANALELMNDEEDDDYSDILNILNFSSNSLTKRLKFFRLCFGLSNSSIKSVDELQSIITDYLSTLNNPQHPIGLNFKILDHKIYKIVMAGVMMMADVITKDGTLSVGQTDDSLIIAALDFPSLNHDKLLKIEQILQNPHKVIEDNPSAFAPLYYLIDYLSGTDINISLEKNALVIGA